MSGSGGAPSPQGAAETAAPRRWWPALEWPLLLAAAASAIVAVRPGPGVVLALGLLSLWALLRAARRTPPTGAGVRAPWAVMIASALLATFIAYDRGPATVELVRLAVTAALFFAVAAAPPAGRRASALALAASGVALAVYWPAQFDFAPIAAKLPGLARLGATVGAALPRLPGPAVDANIAAAVLALALPFAVACVWLARRAPAPIVAAAALGPTLVTATLVLTASRGAWAGSVVVALVCAATGLRAWRSSRQRPRRGAPVTGRGWSAAAALAALAVIAVVAVLATREPGREAAPLTANVPAPQSRLELWQQDLRLAREYLYTGSGLRTFPVVHGVYGLLLHVPLQHHAHSTVLQIAIEQGLLGVAALLLGALALARRWRWAAAGNGDVLTWAGLAAVTAAALHGLVDVPLWGARTLPLAGVAAGLAWGGEATGTGAGTGSHAQAGRRRRWRLALVAVAALVALGAVVLPGPRAIGYGNLGALRQTRTELSRYDPDTFQTLTLDAVRRGADLEPARRALEHAVRLAPRAAAPLERLAAIALSRGDYDAALELARRAHAADPGDERARLLLGDALVANGRVEEAAAAVRRLRWASSRLAGQAWYRYQENGDLERAAWAWQAVLRLDPGDAGASYSLEEVRRQRERSSMASERPSRPLR